MKCLKVVLLMLCWCFWVYLVRCSGSGLLGLVRLKKNWFRCGIVVVLVWFIEVRVEGVKV